MSEFLGFLEKFKWFVLVFLGVILIVILPIKLKEHKILEIVLVVLITTFILVILFGLSSFFKSMAIDVSADNENLYLSYQTKNVAILHENIEKVKCGKYRYIFTLKNGEKHYLTRVVECSQTGVLKIESETLDIVKKYYNQKIK